MPLKRDEFDKGRTDQTTESIVERFLSSNKGSAYTVNEISSSLYKLSGDGMTAFLRALSTIYAVDTALDHLVKEGKVLVNTIKGQNGTNEKYYIIR